MHPLLNPDGPAPLLLVCDHASRAIPAHLGTLGLPEALTHEHIAWDIGAAALTEGLAGALGAPAVLAAWSRLVVDCNRHLDEPSAFIEVSDGIPIPGNAALTEEARRWRIEHCYEPYHQAIEAQIARMQRAGVTPAVVAVHSFTPRLRSAGVDRPWHVGILWDTDDRLAAPLLEGLRREPGLVVGDNEPYSGRRAGDHTIDHHAETHGFAHVGIEVRQDQLLDPAGIQRWVDLLSRALRPLLADPAGFPLQPPTQSSSPRPRPW
ncbi:MAG: N-formylglutamate amidohydrolase [Gammaproteobacteria bacterium]|nr:N-formylglutamate amidohydrolase [Gammaproteobacteria bacterium]